MRRLVFLLLFMVVISSCGKSSPFDKSEYLVSLPVKQVQVDDVKLSYRIFGTGEPLLLIMGFAGTMDLWDMSLVRKLSNKYTVIIYDNRGMGSSGLGEEPITIRNMAKDGAGLIHALGYEKAHIFGWSMGGLIAQELALNSPSKVDKLILMGAACDSAPVEDITRKLMKMDTKQLLTHFFPQSWLKEHPDAFSLLPRPASAAKYEIVKYQAEAMINWDGTCERLAEIQKDTLIISGVDDDILPENLSLQLAEGIEGAWLVRFKNAAHWLMYQDPLSLARTVSTFLEVNEDMLD